jgi:recombination protein RecA
MARKKKGTSYGKLSISDMKDLINAKHGNNVAFDLKEANPTEVTQWIPTGSRWLDSIICRGKLAGVPVGRITEIAGLSGTGKSYMAVQIAANAQALGLDVVYFDAESAISPEFMEKCGVNLDKLLYVQARSIEFVFDTIETLLGSNETPMLFIWDSLAATPTEAHTEADSGYNPRADVGEKPRILAKAFPKVTMPIADHGSTMLVLNQLKTRIPKDHFERMQIMTQPYFAPGGKTNDYFYSLRIWLTGRKSKSAYAYDENDFKIGSEVKCKLEKSRFGTEGRVCTFRILWAVDEPRIDDEESWLEALQNSEYLNMGAWCTLIDDDGVEVGGKFRRKDFVQFINETPAAKERILELMDREVIMKFDAREGHVSEFYSLSDDEVETDQVKAEE